METDGFHALFANLLVGVGIKFARAGHLLLLVLPLVIATAFFLVADIDTPRSGDIHVQPQNLQALLKSLRAP